jgi:hypothetical protein
MVTFDLFEVAGKARIARRPAVAGSLTGRTATDDNSTGSPRPAISDYPDETDIGYDYAPWGAFDGDDNLPNRIEAKFAKVSIAAQASLRLAKLMYGNGLVYFKEADLARTAQPERHYDPAVEEFLAENMVNTEWFFPQCLDWTRHWNTFSEMKLSLSRKYVVGLYHKEAPFCRLSKQDRMGTIKYLLYDARFAWNQYQRYSQLTDTGNTVSESTRSDFSGTATLLPLLTWWDARGFFDRLRGYTFSWHSRIRYGRSVYYARPPWMGLFLSNGWMDVAADVPRIVNSMQQNQIQLKYQILVEESYFKIEHPEWDSYTNEQRSAALDRFEDAINDKFVGVDKGFASILSVFRFDPLNTKELGKVQIIPIDDKIKRDSWVPGAERANFEIVQGLGAHPTDFGLKTENGAMGAGSGSDKREVYNTAINLNTIEQEYILGPLNFISRYNQWGVRFMVDHTAHTTSNLIESGMVPSRNTIQPTDAGTGEG